MDKSGVAVVTRPMMLVVANGIVSADELVIMLLYATSQVSGGDTVQDIANILKKKPATITKCLCSLVERNIIGLSNGNIDLSPLYGFVQSEGLIAKKDAVPPKPQAGKTSYQIWEVVNAIVPCPQKASLGIIANLLKTYTSDEIIGCYTDIAKHPRNKRPDGYINVSMSIVAHWIAQWKNRGQQGKDSLSHLYEEHEI